MLLLCDKDTLYKLPWSQTLCLHITLKDFHTDFIFKLQV